MSVDFAVECMIERQPNVEVIILMLVNLHFHAQHEVKHNMNVKEYSLMSPSRLDYNRERPHGALGNLAPVEYAQSVK